MNEQAVEFLLLNPLLVIVMAFWVLLWKGFALWMSAQRGQRNWFVALLVLNTLGALEIFYILYTRYKEKTQSEEVILSETEQQQTI